MGDAPLTNIESLLDFYTINRYQMVLISKPRPARHSAPPALVLSGQCPMALASSEARCMLADMSLATVLCSSTAAAVEATYS